MTKYLITGAAGFVGSHLVEYLLEEGVPREDLRLFLFNRESSKNLPPGDFDIFRGDIRRIKDVKKAVRGMDVVYHLAAMTIKPNRTYKDYATTNVQGTQNLLDACREEKIKKFVFFSSIAVFGLPAYVGEINNWNEEKAKKPSEDYGKSKLEAEKRVIKAGKERGLSYAIVRPTTVYGPRDHQSLIELFRAIDKGYFFMIGSGENKMDYVFVKDLVKGARQAQLSKKRTGDFILGAGKPNNFKKIARLVSKSLGKRVPGIHIPKILGLILGEIFSVLNRLFGVKFPFSIERAKVMTTSCYFNIEKACKEIGYNPGVSLEKGINITAEWYLKNGK